ncbi:MAG: histidinol-phosphate transaminase [Puniceicoccaceae bacterium]|nr:MAG: histidinol-phosphate transaminase [Puniceicoccaceae bacterium]
MAGRIPPPLPHVAALEAYTPGTQPAGAGWIKLNTNENPCPPAPEVAAAIREAAGDALRLYPEPRSAALRAALARHHDLAEENVLAVNGSDEALALLVRAYTGPGAPVGYLDPSYSLYPVLARAAATPQVTVPCPVDFSLPVEAVAVAACRLFFLTSPHAPSGRGFSRASLAAVAASFSGLLVVDEAYADFADEDAVALLDRHPNLVVVRTFSKGRSLAGLRVGYVLAAAEVIGVLDRIRDSYNLDRLAQAGALAALGAEAHHARCVAEVKATREWLTGQLAERGWETVPSQANFVFTTPRDGEGRSGAEVARGLFEWLESRKVLVRHFPRHPLTASGLRITVGTRREMDRLLEEIDSWPNRAKQP